MFETLLVLATLLATAQEDAARQIDRAVLAGIDAGAFPGAVVVVGTQRRVLLAKGYGSLTWSGSTTPDPDSTLWDLASLTKVVATTAAAMLLVDRGRLDLDRAVQEYLPGFAGEGKHAVTVRHLLAHQSGLRAFLPLNTLANTAEEARQTVLREPLRSAPGGRVEYGDLNAMVLGWIVERVSGRGLDEFAAQEIFGPLGMSETRYRLPRALRRRAAPVGLWRGHAIAGELHDQNAVRLGSVSGHAGLYSTGGDLARYAQFWLRRGQTAAGLQLVRAETVRDFAHRRRGNRALGWEMRDTTTTENTGSLLTPAAFGHGGFTGTSIWIDPEQDLFVVLLTNRVYAPRTRRSITTLKQVRGRLADAAVMLRRARCDHRSFGLVEGSC